MKSHVWRPLYVVIGIVAAILLFRMFYVPEDFGSGEYGFMYSYTVLSVTATLWMFVPRTCMGLSPARTVMAPRLTIPKNLKPWSSSETGNNVCVVIRCYRTRPASASVFQESTPKSTMSMKLALIVTTRTIRDWRICNHEEA